MFDKENGISPVALDGIFYLHFQLSLIAGWWLFHRAIYPLAYFAKGSGGDLAAQLPIYAINVLAFGCLTYTASRPLVLFGAAIVSEVSKAFAKLSQK